MGIQGVQAGPDQIADGQNPSIVADVSPSGQSANATSGLQVYNTALDQQTGAIRPVGVDASGKTVLSDSDKLTWMLVEMRIQTMYLAAIASGLTMTDDPDTLRSDADVSGLFATLS